MTIEPEIAQVTVIRGNSAARSGSKTSTTIPSLDIALRGGDRILVEEDTRSFTALGATGAQARSRSKPRTLSALEAIAQVGGLNSTRPIPPASLCSATNRPKIAHQVLGRNDSCGAQRMVYVLDLTKPNGMFMARDFVIRDGDTLYVTEAPFTQWNKVISALTGTLTAADSVDLAGRLISWPSGPRMARRRA